MKHIVKSIIFTLTIITITSCGGGGGGGESVAYGPGSVGIDVSPNTIDTGDTTTVTVDLSDTHPDGILVKLKFPSTLTYVVDSAKLEALGKNIPYSPSFNKTWLGFRYLVFFMSPSRFGDSRSGTLRLELKGNAVVANGEVAVDVDTNDLTIPDDAEFVAASPKFAAEDAQAIKVKG